MIINMELMDDKTIPFVSTVYGQNREVLHGPVISLSEWYETFGSEADPYEVNYIVTADGTPAAWLKINGINKERICLSMLVVDDSYKRKGIGSFAVRFVENFAKENAKTSVCIQTTKDNIPATQCYLKQGYAAKDIFYAAGDGIYRDGYEFTKEIKRDIGYSRLS